ncbi:MAG: type II secretion system F family protein [Planctomycetaceae bacterium]
MIQPILITTRILAQNDLFGIPLARLLIWLMFALILILVLRLGYRLFRWIARLTATSTPISAEPPRTPPGQSMAVPPPVLRKPADVPPADSIIDADLAEAAADSSSRVRITNREAQAMIPPEAKAYTSAPPLPEFVAVASSQESRSFTGKDRSWTSRSLFGKPITGMQQDLPRLEPGQIPFSDTSDYQFGGVTPALASLLPESENRRKTLKRELIQAGYLNPHAYENLAAVRYLGLMLPLLVFGILLVFGPPQLEPVMLVFMVVGAIMGWALPRLFVRNRSNSHRHEIEQALPDVIDLLNMCVSQGMTLRAALARVSWEITDTYPAMAEELAIVAEQSNLGTLEHALDNMNERIDLPELHSLTSLLTQTERMGTNVSDALTDYSDAMRSTLQQRADQKANAATFKLLFPTVLCLMPAVYFFLLGPAVVELSDFFEAGGLDRYRQTEVRRTDNQPQEGIAP